MIVRTVGPEDIEPVVEALASAFDADPLISFLFGENWRDGSLVSQFFRILLEVRVSLGMPAFCAEDGSGVLGGAMGYDSSRPAWRENHTLQWSQLLEAVDGLDSRLDAYAQLAETFEPPEPHFYLGVIGVAAGRKGGGIGAALLGRFCESSANDIGSSGVYLETASQTSLRFYLKNGFKVRGEGVLGKDTSLWCVFKPTGRDA